ncbi:hypothetical protein KIW84_021801 [Lathyrus oleraceus]|uniref:Retroviral polymerase SH3-like domain-containing protein n=1 Tax=Pisum sativum TaxID=3888 RepID=A0A9D4YAU7_PEA|nr:hypothetical protein KIW84_021801 [Pisum sativum]
MGKQHGPEIPKQSTSKAKAKLELVHSDVCGPIKLASNGGNKYFITFTYDFSRKNWSYFLDEKVSAFDVIKQFKSLVEKESVNNKTPEEACICVNPIVHHFKVFGCVAFVDILDVYRKKLDMKSTKCVHLILSEESMAYKLYDPINNKIRRDVAFKESKGWEWSKNGKEKKDHSTRNVDAKEEDIENEEDGIHIENNDDL